MKKIALATVLVLSPILSPLPAEAKPTGRCAQYERAISNAGLRPVSLFSRIMWRESRCNAAAVNTRNRNGTHDHGLFQINDINRGWLTKKGLDWSQRYDPAVNIAMAGALFRTYGTRPWKATR